MTEQKKNRRAYVTSTVRSWLMKRKAIQTEFLHQLLQDYTELLNQHQLSVCITPQDLFQRTQSKCQTSVMVHVIGKDLAALHLDFFIWYQVSKKYIGRSNKGNGSNLQDNNKSAAWPSLIEKCRLQMFLNRQTFGIWPQANRVQHIIENDISNNK